MYIHKASRKYQENNGVTADNITNIYYTQEACNSKEGSQDYKRCGTGVDTPGLK